MKVLVGTILIILAYLFIHYVLDPLYYALNPPPLLMGICGALIFIAWDALHGRKGIH